MKIQVETVSPVERKVTIEVDPERVAKELERAYDGLSRRVKLRGFRPGKAPRNVLERHFKDQVEGEVVEKLVTSTFGEAVKEHALEAVAPPNVSFPDGGGALPQGQPLRFTARVEVKPRVEPKDYRGLEVARRAPEVTDAMVADELTKLQESMGQLVPAEGQLEAREGDYAVIDHEGTIDGQPFEGGRAEGVTVKVGAGAIQEGFIPQLVGRKLGETVEFDEVLPADHRSPELRGKSAHMKVTLKSLKQRQLPSLDDALAKSVGLEGVETLDALRARIRTDLEKREARRSDAELRDALLKAALAKNEFEVPPALVERAIDAMIEGAAERFARSGIDIRQLDLDLMRMRADLREQALLQVRGALLLEAIAETEKLDPSEEDYQAELAKVADEIGVPLAKLQAQMRGKDAREALRNRIREEKALAVLREAANIQSQS